jgi:hypothetical protein
MQLPCRAHTAQNDSSFRAQLALLTPFRTPAGRMTHDSLLPPRTCSSGARSSSRLAAIQSDSGRKSADSIHEEIWLPAIVHAPHDVAYEHDVIRSYRPSQQRHLRFTGQAVSFFVVAAHASRHKVLPGILTAFCSRHHVINCQRHVPTAAILTTMPIAPQDILPRKHNLFKGDTNVDREANDAWERHR